jgi:hypothetical protein
MPVTVFFASNTQLVNMLALAVPEKGVPLIVKLYDHVPAVVSVKVKLGLSFLT